MRIDESAEKTGSQPFDDGFSLNPASELKPVGLLMPEVVIEENADVAVTQSELDLRAQANLAEGQSLSPIEASLRRLGRDRRAMVCFAIVLILVVGSYLFPFSTCTWVRWSWEGSRIRPPHRRSCITI